MFNQSTILTNLRRFLYLCIIFASTANAQIMYNKVKPLSYELDNLKHISELHNVDFPVEDNGSMMQSNLNIKVKDYLDYELAKNKNIARMLIKINARSLGNMTLHFKDVLLQNGSYCLIYTKDYQIVAGPIYQGSINSNQFTIMNIPASELVLEVIFKGKNDFTLTLDEVSFKSLVNINKPKKKNKYKLLSGNCDNLGVVDFKDNVLNLHFLSYDPQYGRCDFNNTTNKYNLNMGCEWLGAQNIQMNDLKTFSKFKSINDIGYTDFKASRATCNFMLYDGPCPADTIFPDSLRYKSHNAILINIPSQNCEDSYILVAAHQLGAYGIDSLLNSQYARENSIVRFNYHYKYGTPENLFDVICASNPNNFQLWRNTIDFSEVIDYQGVEIFAMDTGEILDFVILKLNCKTFYKEHHLGWTKQTKFDTQYNFISNDPKFQAEFGYMDKIHYKPFSENTYIIGSRAGLTPKLIIHNFFTFPGPQTYVVTYDNERYTHPNYNGFNYSGYSGSCIFYKNYLNSGNEIAYSLIQNSGGANAFSTKINFKSVFDSHISNPPTGYYSISEYFTGNGFNSLFNNEAREILHYRSNGTNTVTAVDSFYWYPSMDNKEKCPSTINQDSICDFNINDYVDITDNGDSICFSINEIPASKFPDPTNIPKGFRIYHNFGEQKTIKWESFQDGSDITFPIEFCLSKCDLLDLLSIGKDGLDIAIDFYDEYGSIYNHPGCDTAIIHYEFPTFCELFNVDIQKIDSSGQCCTYKIDLTINYDLDLLDDCSVNPNIIKLLDSLYFKSSLEPEPLKLQEMDSLNFDTLNGHISFEYTPCPDSIPTNTSFQFMISNDGVVCEIESIDFPYCACDCPENVEDWVSVTVPKNEYPCGVDQCRVDIKIDIPSLEGQCYEFYTLDDDPNLKPIPQNGIINYTPPCIFKGETKEIQIKLYTSPLDTIPCLITKTAFCPYVDENDLCQDSCYVEWEFYKGLEMDLPGCDPDCKIKIDFAYRKQLCTNSQIMTYDIQILKLESFSTNPSNPDACAFCSYSNEELYKLALINIIYQNPMGYPPYKGNFHSCRNYWRVFNKSCWTRITLLQFGTLESPSPNFALVPCQNVSCCKVGLKVCYDVNDNLSLEVIDAWTGIDSCNNEYYNYNYRIEGPSIVYDSSLCKETCEDWINNLDTAGYKSNKLIFSEDKKELIEDILVEIITIANQIEINLYSESDYYVSQISLFDMQGILIFNESININKGLNHKIISTSDLSNGLYLVQIKIGYDKFISKKIIIMR